MTKGKLGFSIAINLAADKFKHGIKSVQSQLSTFKKFVGNAFVGLGIMKFTKDVAQVGGAFQDAMARVKSVSKASRTEFKAMKDEALLLGSTTRYTASQAADAMEILVRNGMSATQAVKATSSVLQLAQSQAIGLAEAADITTRALNGFNLEVKDTNRINDILASAASNSASNVLEFGEALKYAAPVANVLNISMEETMTLLAQLAQRGIKGSEAGTAVKQILMRIASQTPEATKVLKKYGLEINETTLRTKGLMATLDELRKSGIGNSLEDIDTFAGKLAAPKFAAALSAPMDELYKSISESEGEAARMFTESLGEFEKAKWELKSIYEAGQIKVFEGLKDIFTKPLVALTKFIKALQDLPTVASIAFSAIAMKAGSSFSKIRSNLFNTKNNELQKQLQKYKDAVNDVDIAQNFKQTSGRIIRTGGAHSDINFYKDLSTALKESSSSFDLATKGGLEFNRVLKDVNYLSTHTNTTSRTYQKHLANYQSYVLRTNAVIVADGKKSAATELATFQAGMQGKMASATSGGKVITTAFKSMGNSIAGFGRGLFAMMGGWIGVIITLAGVIGTTLVSAFRNSTKAARELNNAHKEAIQKNTELDTTFKNLVNVLRNNEKSTTQYKAALEVLKREYPELIEKLELEKISVNNSAEEWKKYKNRIDDAIESQKRFNLATMKIEAQKGLIKSVEGDSDYKNAVSRIKKIVGDSQYKGNDVVVESITNAIVAELSNTITESMDEAARTSEIEKILQEKFNSLGIKYTSLEKRSDGQIIAKSRLDKPVELFSKSMNKAAKLYNTLDTINTDDATPQKTGDDLINDYLSNQRQLFELEREEYIKTEQAKGRDLEEINSDLANKTKSRIDDIFDYAKNNFNGLKDKKGNDIDYSEYIKNNSDYITLLSSFNYQKPINKKEQTRQGQITDIYQRLDSVSARKSENLKSGVIDEAKYNSQMKAAIESAISSLEMLDIDEADASFRKLIKANEEYAAKIVADNEAKEANKQAERERKETERRLKNLQESSQKKYNNILSGAGKEKLNKWDLVSTDEDNEQGIKVDYIKNQLDALRQLRADIGNDSIALVDELDNSIEALTSHVNNLEDAFQLKKAQKELKNLKKQMNDEILGTITSTWGGITNLTSSVQSLNKAFEDGNGWDKFSTLVDTILNLINTISSLINMYDSLSQTIKSYQTFQETLTAVQTASATEKIVAIQGEAAAVVESEAIKATAKSAAMAETAAASVAASTVIAGANHTEFKTSSTAGIASAVKGAAALPFPANLVAMPLAAATSSALFASIPSMVSSIPFLAEGGVATKPTLAMIGEGAENEAVLPLSKLNSMLDTARQQGTGGQVEFRIEGANLVGVLNNYNKRMKKLK